MAIVKGKEFLNIIPIFKRIYVFTECSLSCSKIIETKSPIFDLQTVLKEVRLYKPSPTPQRSFKSCYIVLFIS